jgi:flagellar motor switch protein FliN/FliY
MDKAPFFWVRKIADTLSHLDTIPLFGNAPPFPWPQLDLLFSSSFHKKIAARPFRQEWKNRSDLKKELGAHFFTVSISITPLGANLFWMMPRADVDKLTSHMLYEKGKGKTSEIIREGFYRYLLLEGLSSLQQIEPLKKLTLQLDEEAEIQEENHFCVDLEIQIDDKTCWGTLAIPPSFREKWVAYFSQASSEYFPTETARQTELILGLKIGESLLTQKEWEAFSPGDFLLLDKSSYDAHQQMGMATMRLGTLPLFQVKVKENQIELLDYIFSYEEPMEHKKEEAAASLQPADEEAQSIKNIPLNITVELARLQMSLDQLMHLSPGNLLELPIHPAQGVSLCVHGRKIGTGELIHLGEALGIRILTIGS